MGEKCWRTMLDGILKRRSKVVWMHDSYGRRKCDGGRAGGEVKWEEGEISRGWGTTSRRTWGRGGRGRNQGRLGDFKYAFRV